MSGPAAPALANLEATAKGKVIVILLFRFVSFRFETMATTRTRNETHAYHVSSDYTFRLIQFFVPQFPLMVFLVTRFLCDNKGENRVAGTTTAHNSLIQRQL